MLSSLTLFWGITVLDLARLAGLTLILVGVVWLLTPSDPDAGGGAA